MRGLIVFFTLCAMPAALPAQTADPAPASAASAPAPAEKPSCRYFMRTGSIMPGKTICLTKAHWREIDTENRLANDHALNRDQAGNRGAPGSSGN
ncbi:MAG TPA: hypothetical protein VK533_16705 [Sphingomonas sp.]|uniref:hypothetical protein n=1 Tax=Sphingomonas sp. TaxID=28214 RepID=UPI002BA5253F|nr:hypothetical protein [Sphingomonas sp.]HMI21175.1 hypothetical protein [Sphingomonas sp.]